MFQKGNDRHRISGPEDSFQCELRQSGLRRGGKRRTGGIVGFDTEALQFRRHAPGQSAIGRDQRGLRRAASARRFKRQPQRHRNCGCLFALVCSFYQGRCRKSIVEKSGLLVLTPAVPVAGGFGRSKCCRKNRRAFFKIAIDSANLNDIVSHDIELLQQHVESVLRMGAA
ncbi:hypothetical protein D3C87_1441340 [compost metagenome]